MEFTISIILSVQFSGIKHSHIAMQPITTIYLQTFSLSQTETQYSLMNKPPFSAAPFLVTTFLLSVSMDMNILGTSYELNHTIFVPLHLAYLSIMSLRSVHGIICIII